MSEPWWLPDQEYKSTCCNAVSEDELDCKKTVLGRCSKCHELSVFYKDEEGYGSAG